ncbi:gluconokinase [uncultured Amnibacterium sp.]|uniref:gluconokinase n=1 Tax=uncultured Amnibacterium sp. TaxID=1631851 RepID=UPI0035CA2EFE
MGMPPVVVMGVSGCGKSTVAAALADRQGGVYLDADDFHPPSNVHKMQTGVPLTDEDRGPWLDNVALAVHQRAEAGEQVFMACSALKRVYRDRIRVAVPDVAFLLLTAPRAELERRLHQRHGHFMPPSLLDSQLQTLQPLSSGERGVTIDVSGAEDVVLDRSIAALEHV